MSEIERADGLLSWVCRFHRTDWWHEVGCPHIEWTKEQLQSAIESNKRKQPELYAEGQKAESQRVAGLLEGNRALRERWTAALNREDALRLRVDALEKDKARLDWIIDTGMWCLQANNPALWSVFVPGDQGEPDWKEVANGKNPREAIDAARTVLEATPDPAPQREEVKEG